jgi:dolichyl-phosphate beta-glucosyltransferase
MELRSDGVGAEARPLSLSVVIPAYREATRLTRTLDATVRYLDQRGDPYEIVLVDDGSPDETAPVARNWAADNPPARGCLRVLRYETNRGKGHAVRYGILQSDARAKRILFMDADLATPIEEIEKLDAALDGGADFAIGSRPLRESQLLVRQPLYRELAGRLFNGVVQTMATPGIHDTQCGFKLLTGPAARAVFSRCILDGFSFDVEALFVARRLGLKIAEVPVRWAHQEGAASFQSKGAYLRHGIHMLRDLARIRWAHRDVRPVLRADAGATVAATSHPPA